MPPARRRPRWNIGDLYAIHLTPRHDAICQLLRSPYVAILMGAVAADSPAPSADEILRGSVYRVLAASPNLVESTRIGHLPFLVTTVPPFFQNHIVAYGAPSRYSIWEDGVDRPATRDECRGLEEMAIWSHDGLVERLRDQFLRGGYVPPAHNRP